MHYDKECTVPTPSDLMRPVLCFLERSNGIVLSCFSVSGFFLLFAGPEVIFSNCMIKITKKEVFLSQLVTELHLI